MVLANAPTFIRRANPESTTDSICTECLTIVCRSASDSDINLAERGHRCDPALLAYWESLAQPRKDPAEAQPAAAAAAKGDVTAA